MAPQKLQIQNPMLGRSPARTLAATAVAIGNANDHSRVSSGHGLHRNAAEAGKSHDQH
jgi:hypothetical protein